MTLSSLEKTTASVSSARAKKQHVYVLVAAPSNGRKSYDASKEGSQMKLL